MNKKKLKKLDEKANLPAHQAEIVSRHYKSKEWNTVILLYEELSKEFPDCSQLLQASGGAYANMGNFKLAIRSYLRLMELDPSNPNVYNNLGVLHKSERNYEKALLYYRKALELRPDFAEAHNNLGNLVSDQGHLEASLNYYNDAIEANSNFIQAYLNLGVAYLNLGQVALAVKTLKLALTRDPNNPLIYWHLYGCSPDIQKARYYLKQCLYRSKNNTEADLAYTFLKAYCGSTTAKKRLNECFNDDDPQVKSVKWVYALKNKPKVFFNRWAMFDFAISKSIKSRPFYEFGVWRGAAFRYLIRTFKKGYGFDTFTGLPEEWHNEKKGSYNSDGIVPKIGGGEFVVGKFETTLPLFFGNKRPIASLINFDADLYSSTICALTNCRNVIDKDTVLIFDEFIMNDNWEEDEYKALEEFCAKNNLRYEVLAVSFCTKQVALRLVGL